MSFQNLKGGGHHIWGCSLGSDFVEGSRVIAVSFGVKLTGLEDLSSGISWPSG